MNSQTECKLFDIKHEVDPHFMTEMKSELQDIESEMKTEENECGDIDVKQETIANEFVASVCPTSEVEETERSLDTWFQDYKKKSQDDQINIEEDEANVVPVAGDNCETTRTDLEEEMIGVNMCKNTGGKADTFYIRKNSFFQCNSYRVCTKTPDKYFKCNNCCKSLSHKSNLTSHMNVHTGEKCFACNVCIKSFPHEYNLGIRSKGKAFVCKFCNISFSQKSTFVLHTCTHTDEKPYTCNVCSMSFTKKSGFERHTITHMKKNPLIYNIISVVDDDGCGTCEPDLEEEKNNIHVCDDRGDTVNISSMCKNQFFQCNVSTEKPDKNFKCKICYKTFSNKGNLNAHLYLHTGEKRFTCSFCSKSFSNKYNLNMHTRIHTKEKPFKCNFCKVSFSQKSTLVVHIRTHTNEKPFTCNICSMSFTNKSHLARHVRIHTNEKPFMCNLCDVSFSRKSTFNQHMFIHTNEKPFICNVCNKSLTNKSDLNRHIRSHTKPFTCNICNMSFSEKPNLNRHTRTHTNEKPFVCNVCDMSFSQKSTISQHMFTHTKEKPFICNACNRSFTRKSDLARHRRKTIHM